MISAWASGMTCYGLCVWNSSLVWAVYLIALFVVWAVAMTCCRERCVYVAASVTVLAALADEGAFLVAAPVSPLVSAGIDLAPFLYLFAHRESRLYALTFGASFLMHLGRVWCDPWGGWWMWLGFDVVQLVVLGLWVVRGRYQA